MMEKFGCVLPYLPPNQSQPICQSRHKNKTKEWEDFYISLSFWDKLSICPLPCKKMTAYFGALEQQSTPNNKFRNTSYAHFKIKSILEHTETVQDFPLTSMLAGNSKWNTSTKFQRYSLHKIFSFSEFGGYVGLLLGYSLADLNTLINSVYEIGYHFLKSQDRK